MEAAFLLLLLIVGVIAGEFCGWIVGGVLISILLGLIIAGVCYGKNLSHIVLSERLFTVASYLTVVVIGVVDSAWRHAPEFVPVEGRRYEVAGIVESRRTLNSGEMYHLRATTIDGEKRKAKLLLFAGASDIFEPGDEIVFTSAVSTPGENTNYKSEVIVFSPGRKSHIGTLKEAGRIKKFFNELALDLTTLIENTGLSDNSKGILKALLLGDRSSISKDKISLFRDAGVIHVLALSGMHIGIIAGVILWLTTPLNLLSSRRYRFLAVIVTVWFFVILTGGAFSTIRAGMMITLTMIAMMLERVRDAFSICCFSAFFMILVWPDVISDIGFQLSFVSVLMLTLLAEPLNPISHRKDPKLYRFFAIVISTVVATLATWMLTAYHFGSASVSFLPANIVILPLLPIYLILGIIYLILSSLGPDIDALSYMLDIAPDMAFRFLRIAGTSQLEVEIGIVTLILWYCSLISLALAVRRFRIKFATAGSMDIPEKTLDRRWLFVSAITFFGAILLIPFNI
ncbi:MAG: ComEC/Rec2 family competence protein [Muribaculaceae bacterium]|nr:ComEC/Rec2 family competence protein [Muribaculaceae bacterium]